MTWQTFVRELTEGAWVFNKTTGPDVVIVHAVHGDGHVLDTVWTEDKTRLISAQLNGAELGTPQLEEVMTCL
ncbi:hypothetical protein ORV05_04715 [Amycolatopsis cynarae]|uniref:Uncharacterized protein n=1 Tax=Amycolatopsis cynarae TaxID=2995223 RepID=A0ABY7B7C9_9PSEU|nr:hypothetical protein [Amycolatopsis sp. HUAS 11-8]WAL67093.1 hypothetical protein ORV05_04715 [Amycolatopsis sp. HUAS 11-8]